MASKWCGLLPGYLILALLQNPSAAQDPLRASGIYPDINGCFEDVERLGEASAIEQIDRNKHHCFYLEDTQDENSLCFKDCILTGRHLIHAEDYPPRADDWDESILAEGVKPEHIIRVYQERRQGKTYTVDPEGATDQLGRNLMGIQREVLYDESNSAKFNQVKERVEKCKQFEFFVPKSDENCKNMGPEYQEKLGQLVACMENAFNCREA